MQLNTKKLIIGISSALIIIIGGIIGTLYYVLHKSVPDYSETVKIDGLKQPVKIYYDEYAAPHIIAENIDDLFFAQGYAHARDRLWQMDIQRRAAQGRLSEIFGSVTLNYDKHMRTVGIGRIADSLWKSNALSSETRQVLVAYSNGVNAYLHEIEAGKVSAPLELDVLNYRPDQWKPKDCLSIVRMMGWEMNNSWQIDVVLAELTQKLGAEKASQVYPDYPKNKPVIVEQQHSSNMLLRDSAQSNKALVAGLHAFRREDRSYRAWSKMLGSHIGSNSWAVTRSKSTTGNAILANDPHLGFATPSRWHEMQLICASAGIDVSGGTLPGVPVVVIGKTPFFSWGITNMMADDADFFVTSDSTEGKYKEIVEEIQVKDGNPEHFLVRISKHGVVLPREEVADMLKTDKAEVLRHDITMKWTGFEMSDEIGAFLKAITAKDWQQFRSSLKAFAIPGQNFLYADVKGNIGYQSAGRIPIRRDKQGFLLRNATDPTQEWNGYIPFEELPTSYNPPSDMIVTANNKIIDDSYPYYITALWEPSSRAERIKERLSEKEKLSPDDFAAIQTDMVSPQARDLMPYLMNSLAMDSLLIHQKPLQYLKNWPYDFDKNSIAATIFAQFFKQLLRNTFADEMGDPLFESYLSLVNTPVRVMQSIVKDSSTVTVDLDSVKVQQAQYNSWFDDVRTPTVETRDDILRKSFSEAIDILRKELGTDEARWQWGAVHQLTVRHVFGQKTADKEDGLMARVFNFPTSATGGTSTTINNGEYHLVGYRPDGKDVLHADQAIGASLRRVIDLANPSGYRSIMPGGNSGEVMSPHYKDQFPIWLQGMLREFVTDPAGFEKRNYKLTRLEPK